MSAKSRAQGACVSLWGRIFARYYDAALAAAEEAGLAAMRQRLLAQASGRTLEIGAGTGLNLDHYPQGLPSLTLCEPEEPMAQRLRPRAAAHGATVLVSPAEAIPVADGSVDTVVSALVLCTVEDPRAAVAEIERVLAPGGRLLFLEHVRSDDPGLARWQDRWDPVWKRYGHGCRCNRPTVATLAASGLELGAVEHVRFPKAPAIVRPAVLGVATRPA